MSHPQLEAAFASWAAHSHCDRASSAALAELRDHAISIYEAELDAGATPDEAAAAALAECDDAELIELFRGESYQRRKRWIMRGTTAALVAGVMAAGSIAIWWPGDTPAPLAVAIVRAQQAPPAAGITAAKPAVDTTEANNEATREKLTKYLAAKFYEAPVAEVLGFIGNAVEIETYVNEKMLAEAGLALDEPVTIQLKRVRADMLLDLALQQAFANAGDYVVRDGIVVISTVDSLEQANEIKAYSVGDLLALHSGGKPAAGTPVMGGIGGAAGLGMPAGATGGLGGPGGAGGGGFGGDGYRQNAMVGSSLPRRASVEQLMDVIRRTVAPDSWEETGGIGTITDYGDMLVIRQNERTHREIDSLLKLLRETGAKK